MALVFTFVRVKVGVVDDTDPTPTPPATADLFAIYPRRHSGSGRDFSKGYIYYLVFKDGGGVELTTAFADVTPYLKDELPAAGNSWSASATDTKVKHRRAFTNMSTWVNDGTVFFRLTKITGAGVASVEIHAEVI